MILKICRKCGKLIPYPKTYCDKCQAQYDLSKEASIKKAKKKYDYNYNKYKRNKEHEKFYNSDEWKMLRAKYLSDHHKCEICLKLYTGIKVKFATEVHHIEWLSTEEGWNRRLDYDNLMALCHYHHNKIHNKFIKKDCSN